MGRERRPGRLAGKGWQQKKQSILGTKLLTRLLGRRGEKGELRQGGNWGKEKQKKAERPTKTKGTQQTGILGESFSPLSIKNVVSH